MPAERFKDEQPAELALEARRSESRARVVQFPARPYPDALPDLVRITSCVTGERVLAVTTKWGNANMDPAATALRTGHPVWDRLQRKGEPFTERHHPVLVRSARLRDIFVYEKGWGLKLWVHLSVCLAAIAVAAAAYSTTKAPASLALAAFVLPALAAILTAFKNLKEMRPS